MISRFLFFVLLSFIVEFVCAQTRIHDDAQLNKHLFTASPPPLAPGVNFDLSIWSLQLPTGSGTSPTTIPPTLLAGTIGYTDSNYFYTDKSDGAMTFMDPQQGITTSGSLHCRTELREMTSSETPAAWPWNGTNTMTVIGEITQVGGGFAGYVTLGQIFNSSDDIPLCEFEYYTSVNGFKMLYEETKGDGSSIDLNTPCALHTKYTFSFSLTGGVLTISINGNQVYSKSPSLSGKQFYFKCGCYDQTATAGSPSTLPYTTVKIYSLNVLHDNATPTLAPTHRQLSGPWESFIRTRGDGPFLDISGRTILISAAQKRTKEIMYHAVSTKVTH